VGHLILDDAPAATEFPDAWQGQLQRHQPQWHRCWPAPGTRTAESRIHDDCNSQTRRSTAAVGQGGPCKAGAPSSAAIDSPPLVAFLPQESFDTRPYSAAHLRRAPQNVGRTLTVTSPRVGCILRSRARPRRSAANAGLSTCRRARFRDRGRSGFRSRGEGSDESLSGLSGGHPGAGTSTVRFRTSRVEHPLQVPRFDPGGMMSR
jgi:hypothetical protein